MSEALQLSSRHLIDPDLLPMVDAFPHTALNDETLAGFRQLVTKMVTSEVSLAAQQVVLSHHIAPGSAGMPDVKLAVYRPRESTGNLPTILQIHGGGFVAGTVPALEGRHREITLEMQCCLISVDYRLAPETRYPGAIEDCYAALSWVTRHCDELGVSAGTIVLMGESAGGGLAAALALLARDRGEYHPSFQHLTYPMLDDRPVFNATSSPYAGQYIWTADDSRFGWRSLLGEAAGGPDVSPYAAPARATELSGLPPTFIMAGSNDLFANEGIEYARRLIASGVSTELHVFAGGFHGFDLATHTRIGQAAVQASRAALLNALMPTHQQG